MTPMKPTSLWLVPVAFLVLAALACGPVVTVVVTATPEPMSPAPIVPTASPTPAPTSVSTTGPTVPAGWLLYVSPVFGYRFFYPPGVTITETGVEGFPTDELPPDQTPSEYMAELQAMYDNALCVTARYGSGYVSISAPANRDFRYVICGRTGVGAGTMTEKNETIFIAGVGYTASGYEFLGEEMPCDTLPCHNETMVLRLPDGTRIEYGAAPVDGVPYADYLATTRPVLVQIVATFVPGP